MNQIKCPNCGEVFTIDESSYESIVKQIRDQEFSKQIAERERQFDINKKNEVELVKTQTEKSFADKLNEKDNVISSLKNDIELLKSKSLLDKQKTQADLEKQISELRQKLENKEIEKKQAVEIAVGEKEKEILQLNRTIDKNESDHKLELANLETKKDNAISELKNKIELGEKERKINEDSIKQGYEAQLKSKDELIDYYKDLKSKLSTKMIGESLEQHCSVEFNKLRATAFKNAYFEKDNDASSGSKGDFVYRDYDEQGTEIISIMFEMKNENDETTTKHKNEDFFDKLDKDRKKENCEYAVLVSLLEQDNELYNEGIVDVSYRYEKMYVIRPQFFIPLITILKNAALNVGSYKREVMTLKNQNVDVTDFENKLLDFQTAFGKNYTTAVEYYEKAIGQIDDAISKLENIKKSLTTSGNQLRLANNKAMDLSVKKLVKGNPTMTKLFEEKSE